MIAVILVVVSVLGGTIAYFTTTSTFNNQFASKPYSTKVTEHFVSPDNWTPGTTTDKTVNVENTGEVPVAVRVKFEEKWTDSNGSDLPITLNNEEDGEKVAILNFADAYENEWTLRDDWYYYNSNLNAGDITTDLLKSVTFNPKVLASANCVTTNNAVICDSTGEGYDNATYVLTITIETVQADFKKEYWNLYDVLYDSIKEQASPDNIRSDKVKSDTGINFKNDASATNGQGVYMVASTESTKYPIYYYRGDVTNNNVLFADFCWQIVRTTETGGIKLIYNGLPVDQDEKKVCTNTNSSDISTSSVKFSELSGSLAYIGYMYGDEIYKSLSEEPAASVLFGKSATYDESTKNYSLTETSKTLDVNHHYTCNNSEGSCEELRYYTSEKSYIALSNGVLIEEAVEKRFANTNNSNLKEYIENDWYANNMTRYTKYLEDTVWCNDRSFEEGDNSLDPNGGSLSGISYAAYKHMTSGNPTLSCSERDSLTVSNQTLKYPVGLINIDEFTYAGAMSDSNYLVKNSYFWTMTPYTGTISFPACSNILMLAVAAASSSNPVRPVVSLKVGSAYYSGTGEPEDPYVIVMN